MFATEIFRCSVLVVRVRHAEQRGVEQDGKQCVGAVVAVAAPTQRRARHAAGPTDDVTFGDVELCQLRWELFGDERFFR